MKSQNVKLDIGAFCSLHEMHTQFRNKTVDGKNIVKYFGCGVVLSLLVALSRLHQLPRTNGLKIGIDIGFIILFLWLKRRMIQGRL